MEPQIVDYYNEMPMGVNVIAKLNEELEQVQKELEQVQKEFNKKGEEVVILTNIVENFILRDIKNAPEWSIKDYHEIKELDTTEDKYKKKFKNIVENLNNKYKNKWGQHWKNQSAIHKFGGIKYDFIYKGDINGNDGDLTGKYNACGISTSVFEFCNDSSDDY